MRLLLVSAGEGTPQPEPFLLQHPGREATGVEYFAVVGAWIHPRQAGGTKRQALENSTLCLSYKNLQVVSGGL